MGVLDGTIAVSEEAAFDMARRCAKDEGVFIGISSGATLAALQQKACRRYRLAAAC